MVVHWKQYQLKISRIHHPYDANLCNNNDGVFYEFNLRALKVAFCKTGLALSGSIRKKK